jgi:hypothetical protein
MVKKCINVILILIIIGSVGWYVWKNEKAAGEIRSHAISNSMMATENAMMLQMFFETAPDEIMRMIRMTKCNCGHDSPLRSITNK